MKRFFTLLGVVCMMLSALAVPRRSALSVAALPDGKLPKDTVVYIFPKAHLQDGQSAVVIDGEIEGEVIASALIYTTNIVGTYTSKDFEMVYSTFVRFPEQTQQRRFYVCRCNRLLSGGVGRKWGLPFRYFDVGAGFRTLSFAFVSSGYIVGGYGYGGYSHQQSVD